MSDKSTIVDELKRSIRAFVRKRNWERYHNLKDLAIAISVEASELLDIFKWRSPERVEGDEELMRQVKNELADVLIYAIRFTDVAGIDISEAISEKLKIDEKKYPEGIDYQW